MKKLLFIALGLLIAAQAHAFGDRERSALLGFGAGVIVAHLANQHSSVAYEPRATYREPERVVYVEKPHHKYNHHKKERHHARKHERDFREVVVVNRYRDYYYH